MRKLLIAALLGWTPTAVAGQTAAQPEIVETCREHMVAEGTMTPRDWPEKGRGRELSELVAVAYELDGTGRAINPHVVKQSKRRVFDPITVKLLERSQFSLGIVAQDCVYVRTYEAMRRR